MGMFFAFITGAAVGGAGVIGYILYRAIKMIETGTASEGDK